MISVGLKALFGTFAAAQKQDLQEAALEIGASSLWSPWRTGIQL